MCPCGNSRATYNLPGESTPKYCAECKDETMIDVVHARCRCNKAIPVYNLMGVLPPICCAECKTEDMVNVYDKRCFCGKAIPSFNEPNNPRPLYCADCKTETMVNVVDKKCPGNAITGCPYNRVANAKYKNYCTECFRREFPLDPMTFQIRCKTKEIAVRDFINSVFEGFQHDSTLHTNHCDCTIRRRIDHRKLIGNTLLVIETDENQHKSYDQMDEQTRYDDLFMAHSGKWIYIRFNPDKYKTRAGVSKNPHISTRLEVLKKVIDEQMKRIEKEENTEFVERIYLFYDGYT